MAGASRAPPKFGTPLKRFSRDGVDGGWASRPPGGGREGGGGRAGVGRSVEDGRDPGRAVGRSDRGGDCAWDREDRPRRATGGRRAGRTTTRRRGSMDRGRGGWSWTSTSSRT